VVAGDDGVRRYLPERIQVRPRVRKFPVRAALSQIARDGYRVRLNLCNVLFQGVEAFGDRGTPEVQIRNMRKGDHEQRFYPNVLQLKTLPDALQEI
jgi:hypothetical protein